MQIFGVKFTIATVIFHLGVNTEVQVNLESLLETVPETLAIETIDKLMYYEACVTLAVLLILDNQVGVGWRYYTRALACQHTEVLKPLNLGRVASKYLSRAAVVTVLRSALTHCIEIIPSAISIVTEIQARESTLTIVCVKVGRKYGSEYVNKLFRGVSRHFLSRTFSFLCLTDDSSGLAPEIDIEVVTSDLPLWWCKLLLFTHRKVTSDMLYFDLDVVITGDISPLGTYQGPFMLAGARDIACEDCKDGYNSSIMMWRTEQFERLYTDFLPIKEQVWNLIDRFDHWLEMMIPRADLVQEQFPGLCQDYMETCRTDVPETCGVVIFPQNPKPHECEVAWVRQHWV